MREILNFKCLKENKHSWIFKYPDVGNVSDYRGADKSLARPGRKQAKATEAFDIHMSYL
jgi:L-ribulose-5-phosphate 3-epimerase UlaE